MTIDELITGTNVALGTLTLDQCPAFDANSDGALTIDELIQGVSNGLDGCGTAAGR